MFVRPPHHPLSINYAGCRRIPANIASIIPRTTVRAIYKSLLINMLHKPLRKPNPESLHSTFSRLLNFPPRDGQVDAIRRLAIDQQDLILIAPTGWGKSAIFQVIPALRGGICLMIMPLNLLEEDQVWWRDT